MNILMLTPYLPYPLLSGGQIRTYNLLKQISKKHKVTLFALIKDESEKQYIAELEKYCAKVKVFKRSEKPFTVSNILRTAISSFPFLVIRNHVPEVISAVQKELNQTAYDLIHAETFYMMPHIPPTTIPTILVEQTIEYVGYESYAEQAPFWIRPLLNIDIRKIKKWEQHYWKQADQLVVMSDEDKSFIETTLRLDHPIEVVANGVDIEWFSQKKKKLSQNPTILFVGTFKWLPNIEAVRYLVKKVWPHILEQIPNAQLHIVGNAPTAEIKNFEQSYKNITVFGRVDDIRDAFSQSHVLIAPVFSGKGTRYKVLEAMASQTPLVATPTAVEGLSIKNGTHAMIGESETELAELTISLLSNTQLQKKLSANGKAFVATTYNWETIAHKLNSIYDTIGS